MKYGKLYGIGIGPGDPELITVKGAKIISKCEHVFVPKAKIQTESLALQISQSYIDKDAHVHELLFPMTSDHTELNNKWNASAESIIETLKQGKDACFLTLGDPLLYSTYIYLIRSLKAIKADIEIVTIPGIMALNAAASLTDFPLGEGKENVTIVPTADDLASVKDALSSGGTVVLMKIGKRLQAILELLEEAGIIDDAVFVSRAGQKEQHIETDLKKLKAADDKAGYMSIMLVHTKKENE
jgi:precorrin-2/cobalt-factor-2 C20-methyltransferase